MAITTRTGDGGYSRLLTGARVSKGDLRLEAYGTVDELNAVIGVAVADTKARFRLRDCLLETQRLLFLVGSDLAAPMEAQINLRRVSQDEIRIIEGWIGEIESALPELKRFILPGGTRLCSLLHHTRTVCRRAERCVVRLAEEEKVNDRIQVFLNRLSDYLFLAARETNRGREEEI